MFYYIITYDLDIKNHPYFYDDHGDRHVREAYIRNHFQNPKHNFVYEASTTYSFLSNLSAFEFMELIRSHKMFKQSDNIKIFEVSPNNSAKNK